MRRNPSIFSRIRQGKPAGDVFRIVLEAFFPCLNLVPRILAQGQPFIHNVFQLIELVQLLLLQSPQAGKALRRRLSYFNLI